MCLWIVSLAAAVMAVMQPAAGRRPQRRTFVIVLAIMDTVCTRVGISQGYNQAFIQTDGDLRYLVDGVSVPLSEGLSEEPPTSGLDDEESSITVLGSPIKFEPTELDFREQPLGLPVLRKVRVHNLNAQSSIQMLSISGNTIHFHCSFFTDKVISPSGNTTFDVVFLGREEGPVENTLYIHTSAGSFRFVVRAFGTPNPYRLKPLVGVKVPLNSSYSPLIELHNPHSEPIQVLEMYSSGGDLHLELPSGETEGPQALWQIQPFQTKSVMKANFVARMENNHTAYIRIKTNSTGAEFLYLPLEVEVSSQPGIYCPQELIDFGLMPSGADPRTVKLLVLNSGNKAVPIHNVIATPVTEALSTTFHPMKVPPDTLKPTVIAEVTFNPSVVTEEGLYSGKITIKSKNSQFKVNLPYRAHVLRGRLKVNESSIHFHLQDSDEPKSIARNFTVTNEFSVPIVVHQVGMTSEAQKFFDLKRFKPTVLKSGETRILSQIVLRKEAWKTRLLDSVLTLRTNISDMEVPLLCFHGKLTPFFPGSPTQSLLEFGTLGMNEQRDLYFTVLNRNPVTITLRGWGSNLTGSLVELMGVAEGDETAILQRTNFSDMARRLAIPPGHYMVFRIGILTKDREGSTEATVFVETDYHVFEVPFRFTVAKGSLHTVPRELSFDPVFPGKRAELKLKVYSSFAQEMVIDSISTVPPDPRFTFRSDPKGSRIISGQKSLLGKMIFEPAALCRKKESCYSGFGTHSKLGQDWFQGLSLRPETGDSDMAVVDALAERFHEAITPTSSFNITLNLDTNQVRGFLFQARATLAWPHVTNTEKVLEFPLTQVGNASHQEVLLVNPSEHTICYHLVPINIYPNGIRVANMLPTRSKEVNESLSVFPEAFRVISVTDIQGKSPLAPFPDGPEWNNHDTQRHPDTKAFMLRPGQKARAKVRFRPNTEGLFHQTLFVRNNLTGIEVVDFRATSIRGSLHFGPEKVQRPNGSGADGPVVLFEVREKHLKDCLGGSSPKRRSYSPQIMSVRRTFLLKNTGQTPVYITGLLVEGEPCEGFGFRVLNCDSGFDLAPSESRELDIAFSPDFTLSYIARTLSVKSTLSPPDNVLNFTLDASVPMALLSLCSGSLERPPWEPWLYYGANALMLSVIVMVVLAAYCESLRMVRSTIPLSIVQGQGAKEYLMPHGSPFDLRGVGQQVSAELRQRSADGERKAVPVGLRSRNGAVTIGSASVAARRRVLASESDSSLLSETTARLRQTKANTQPSFLQRLYVVLYWPVNTMRRIGYWAVALPVTWIWLRPTSEEKDNTQGRASSTSSPPSTPSRSPLQKQQSGECDPSLGAKKSETPTSAKQASPIKEKNGVTSTPNNSSRKGRRRPQQPVRKQIHQPLLTKSSEEEATETSSTTTESSNADECEAPVKSQANSTSTSRQESHDLNASLLLPNEQQQKSNGTASSSNAKSNNSSKRHTNKGKKVAGKREDKAADGVAEAKKPVSGGRTGKVEVNVSNNKGKEKVQEVNSNKSQQQQPSKAILEKKSSGQEASKKTANTISIQQGQEKQQVRVKPQEKMSTELSLAREKLVGQPDNFGGPCPNQKHQTSQTPAKAKVTPVGKILPEPKNLGAQYGPVGARPESATLSKSTWSDSPAEPRLSGASSTPLSSALFGPMNEAGLPKREPDFGSLTQPFQDIQQALDPNAAASGNSTTLMQSLQAERVQRTREFLLAQNGTTDWPGFDSSRRDYVSELWDRDTGMGLNQPPVTPQQQQVPQRWPTSPTMDDIWPTWTNSTMPFMSMQQPPPQPHFQGLRNSGLGEFQGNGLGFNPESFSAIWGSPTRRQAAAAPQHQHAAQEAGNSSWSGRLYPQPRKD